MEKRDPFLHLCVALSDQPHPEQLQEERKSGFISAGSFGGQKEMGPDIKD